MSYVIHIQYNLDSAYQVIVWKVYKLYIPRSVIGSQNWWQNVPLSGNSIFLWQNKWMNEFWKIFTPCHKIYCYKNHAINVMSWRFMPSRIKQCRKMLCHKMSCHKKSYHKMSCPKMSCHKISCHKIPCHKMSCRKTLCNDISFYKISCRKIPCHKMSIHKMARNTVNVATNYESEERNNGARLV